MYKVSDKNSRLKSSFLIFMVSLFISGACSNKKSIEDKLVSDNSVSQQIVYEENRPYVKYQSFQNPDSTWGFTIFVNSRPFLLYKKIPVNRAKFGFESRKDAETVAEIFVKMIQNGNLKPSIDLNALDTLGINFKNRKMPG